MPQIKTNKLNATANNPNDLVWVTHEIYNNNEAVPIRACANY